MFMIMHPAIVSHKKSPDTLFFRVTGLFAGQYNTKLNGTITDVIYIIVVSALLRD